MASDYTSLLAKVKISLRRTDTTYDPEILDLIKACLKDLKTVGVKTDDLDDPLIVRAVCTYSRANFGTPPNYGELKTSYDDQKAQMMVASAYTNYDAYGIKSYLDRREG